MGSRHTTDRIATHQLMLSCRRLDTAIASDDPHRSEAARHDTMECMADLLMEFGLTDIANRVRGHLPEFDGRHIEEPND